MKTASQERGGRRREGPTAAELKLLPLSAEQWLLHEEQARRGVRQQMLHLLSTKAETLKTSSCD